MTGLLTEQHKAWIGYEDDPVTIEVNRSDIIKYSIATEQMQRKYLNGDEAPSMFIFNLFRPPQSMAKLREDGLPQSRDKGPKLPLNRVMAGGTEVVVHRPIRPGDKLTSVSRISDIYEKQGSQGPLIFTVRERTVNGQDGQKGVHRNPNQGCTPPKLDSGVEWRAEWGRRDEESVK